IFLHQPFTVFPYTTLFRSPTRLGIASAIATGMPMNMRVIIIAMHHRPATGPDGLVKKPMRQAARAAKQTIMPTRPGFFRRRAERSEEHTSELQSRFDRVCR